MQGQGSSEHSVAVERVTSSYFALTVFYIFLCRSRSVKFVSVSGGVCNGADPKSGSASMRLWVGFYACHHSNEKSGIYYIAVISLLLSKKCLLMWNIAFDCYVFGTF